MRKYKEKFLWRNIFYSYLTVVLLVIIIFFITKGVFNLYEKYSMTKSDLISVNRDQTEVNNKLALSKSKLDNINTDDGKDRFIRDTYNLEKSGEGLVVVYDAPSSTYNIPKSESLWERFMNLFKNLW